MNNDIFNQSLKYNDFAKRNIVFISQPELAFSSLSDSKADLSVIDAVSSLARLSLSTQASLSDFYYATAIGYPFRTTPFMCSRFSDGTYPVWYGSQSVETSIYETAHHAIHFLQAEQDVMQENKIVKKRSIFDVFCNAILIDLTNKMRAFPQLSINDYAFSNEIGKQIHDGGLPGILYPSMRHAGGVNLSIFQQAVLQDPRLLGHLTYTVLPRKRVVQVTGMKLKLDISF